eukprot:CAMPEP_0115106924 /NCGR_PEP_ID=MMETSP0227-20121206/36978_1 /TAXON_ID=89957 /ORGANISM="Polarella glacialis, Strain CCMP 1383" /LENGTH=104 /DNA_ID=CAMNT_0002504681 /DNA_START=149 /DNA_END=463 /DNA_ORIENTATION=-
MRAKSWHFSVGESDISQSSRPRLPDRDGWTDMGLAPDQDQPVPPAFGPAQPPSKGPYATDQALTSAEPSPFYPRLPTIHETGLNRTALFLRVCKLQPHKLRQMI